MDKELKQELWEQFKKLEAKAITMNHYELARYTAIKDVQIWKQFLTTPDVAAYIDQEAQILTQTELRKLASDVSDSRSVGQAQLINAMNKLTDVKTTKEGPAFIYTYVPLSENQMRAGNIEVLDHDCFEKEQPKQDPEEHEDPIKPMIMNLNKIQQENLSDDELF